MKSYDIDTFNSVFYGEALSIDDIGAIALIDSTNYGDSNPDYTITNGLDNKYFIFNDKDLDELGRFVFNSKKHAIVNFDKIVIYNKMYEVSSYMTCSYYYTLTNTELHLEIKANQDIKANYDINAWLINYKSHSEKQLFSMHSNLSDYTINLYDTISSYKRSINQVIQKNILNGMELPPDNDPKKLYQNSLFNITYQDIQKGKDGSPREDIDYTMDKSLRVFTKIKPYSYTDIFNSSSKNFLINVSEYNNSLRYANYFFTNDNQGIIIPINNKGFVLYVYDYTKKDWYIDLINYPNLSLTDLNIKPDYFENELKPIEKNNSVQCLDEYGKVVESSEKKRFISFGNSLTLSLAESEYLTDNDNKQIVLNNQFFEESIEKLIDFDNLINNDELPRVVNQSIPFFYEEFTKIKIKYTNQCVIKDLLPNQITSFTNIIYRLENSNELPIDYYSNKKYNSYIIKVLNSIINYCDGSSNDKIRKNALTDKILNNMKDGFNSNNINITGDKVDDTHDSILDVTNNVTEELINVIKDIINKDTSNRTEREILEDYIKDDTNEYSKEIEQYLKGSDIIQITYDHNNMAKIFPNKLNESDKMTSYDELVSSIINDNKDVLPQNYLDFIGDKKDWSTEHGRNNRVTNGNFENTNWLASLKSANINLTNIDRFELYNKVIFDKNGDIKYDSNLWYNYNKQQLNFDLFKNNADIKLSEVAVFNNNSFDMSNIYSDEDRIQYSYYDWENSLIMRYIDFGNLHYSIDDLGNLTIESLDNTVNDTTDFADNNKIFDLYLNSDKNLTYCITDYVYKDEYSKSIKTELNKLTDQYVCSLYIDNDILLINEYDSYWDITFNKQNNAYAYLNSLTKYLPDTKDLRDCIAKDNTFKDSKIVLDKMYITDHIDSLNNVIRSELINSSAIKIYSSSELLNLLKPANKSDNNNNNGLNIGTFDESGFDLIIDPDTTKLTKFTLQPGLIYSRDFITPSGKTINVSFGDRLHENILLNLPTSLTSNLTVDNISGEYKELSIQNNYLIQYLGLDYTYMANGTVYTLETGHYYYFSTIGYTYKIIDLTNNTMSTQEAYIKGLLGLANNILLYYKDQPNVQFKICDEGVLVIDTDSYNDINLIYFYKAYLLNNSNTEQSVFKYPMPKKLSNFTADVSNGYLNIYYEIDDIYKQKNINLDTSEEITLDYDSDGFFDKFDAGKLYIRDLTL